MLSDAVKKCFALLAAGIILLVGYYGNYLPLRKSQAFIALLRNASSAKTIQEFESQVASVLNLPSPIGQEELLRNFASTAVGIISGTPNNAVVAPLMEFTTGYFMPIISGGKGMSFSQNLYIMGNLNQAAFVKTNDARYLSAAEQYYAEGLRRGPHRPQFLYGLIDVYRLQGNVQGVISTRDKILALWDDQRVNEAVDKFLADVAIKAATEKKN